MENQPSPQTPPSNGPIRAPACLRRASTGSDTSAETLSVSAACLKEEAAGAPGGGPPPPSDLITAQVWGAESLPGRVGRNSSSHRRGPQGHRGGRFACVPGRVRRGAQPCSPQPNVLQGPPRSLPSWGCQAPRLMKTSENPRDPAGQQGPMACPRGERPPGRGHEGLTWLPPCGRPPALSWLPGRSHSALSTFSTLGTLEGTTVPAAQSEAPVSWVDGAQLALGLCIQRPTPTPPGPSAVGDGADRANGSRCGRRWPSAPQGQRLSIAVSTQEHLGSTPRAAPTCPHRLPQRFGFCLLRFG